MRSNAPITVILALAVLLFLPAHSPATTAHHHAAKTVPSKTSKKTDAAKNAKTTAARTVSHHEARKQAVAARPVRETRTSSHRADVRAVSVRGRETHTRELRLHEQGLDKGSERTSLRSRRRSRGQIEETELAATPAPTPAAAGNARHTATSKDFLAAATAPPPPVVQPPVEIHGTSHPAELDEAPAASDTVSRRPAAKPVPVIGVIRPAAERPQLPSVEETAATPVILPALYNKRGRLIVPPALKGSHEILVHQNLMADHDGLRRIQNDEDLLNMRSQGLLVALPVNNALEVDERLPVNRRFCRPWTAQFLATMARAHYAHFHSSLQVNSAVRTVEFQQHLIHINGNAAPAEGDTASPHLTGQAIDIAKHGLSLTEIAWIRGYLLPLEQEGKIDVEEEFQQSCFHISVYKSYLPSARAPRRDLASTHHNETTALAAAMR